MSAVTATEFAKGFGRFKEEAQREPVAITSYGRISGYFVSAHEYEELRRLREFGPSPAHRRSFGPVRLLLAGTQGRR